MQTICAQLLLAALHYAVSGAASTTPPALRITSARIASTVGVLLLRSPTFAEMVRQIGESDVIVYVVSEPCPNRIVQSCLRMMGHGANYRYVRISISVFDPQPTIAAHVAHELQHALEIAHEPAARDLRTLAELYRSIGYAVDFGDVYETAEARSVEQRVSREYAATIARRGADRPR